MQVIQASLSQGNLCMPVLHNTAGSCQALSVSVLLHVHAPLLSPAMTKALQYKEFQFFAHGLTCKAIDVVHKLRTVYTV